MERVNYGSGGDLPGRGETSQARGFVPISTQGAAGSTSRGENFVGDDQASSTPL